MAEANAEMIEQIRAAALDGIDRFAQSSGLPHGGRPMQRAPNEPEILRTPTADAMGDQWVRGRGLPPPRDG
ncbi:hypothetical protein OG410_01225 [Streptomyces sp. NBC_00659]|uniref:hypothetical protein n=1 Tax=Streptomyces sp. NBC_00659 TaxID=2903669 RepID=UPI002E305BD6|nr:hypothetical protein [Streptomyces sp. NBC_00659]